MSILGALHLISSYANVLNFSPTLVLLLFRSPFVTMKSKRPFNISKDMAQQIEGSH